MRASRAYTLRLRDGEVVDVEKVLPRDLRPGDRIVRYVKADWIVTARVVTVTKQRRSYDTARGWYGTDYQVLYEHHGDVDYWPFPTHHEICHFHPQTRVERVISKGPLP